jgi:23S rRNA (adenine2503-C2)-methyltransferase
MENLRDLDFNELTELLTTMGEKAFRAKQLYQWLHVKLANGYDEMTDLSKSLRARLAETHSAALPEAVEILTSKIDGTKKFIFRMHDGHVIESVWMKYQHGNSVCISSQVGCRMGCRFCASTLDGLARNLSNGEMLSQIYQIQRLTGERVDNIVIMGSGEPLDNYDNFTKFVRMISDADGLHISRRNITVSTCGLVPRIRQLADENYGITLALSLHAPNDETRRTLMPIANKYSLSEIMPAISYYFEKTGRRVTFEYSVVQGVNDNKNEAMQLVELIQGMKGQGHLQCHVNLIPVNPIKERDWKRPDRSKIEAFQHLLERHGIAATIRREMGSDISGACGQLRRDYLNL